VECLQPEDQTSEIKNLFDVSEAANRSMVQAVRSAMRQALPYE